MIKDHTRITETCKTIIDLMFINNSNMVPSSGVHSLGLSDHSLVYVVRKNKKIKGALKTVKSCSFKNFNDQVFVISVKSVNWDEILNFSDVDSAWNDWKETFINVCDKHAPIRERRVKRSLLDWITNDYVKLSKDRDCYYSKVHKANDPDDWKTAKSLRNKVNNLGKTLKKKYCTDSINQNVNNSKKRFGVLSRN